MRILFILAFCMLFPICSFGQTQNALKSGNIALLEREKILDDIFKRNAKEFGLPYQIVKAISRQESDCSPLVININGRDYHPKSVSEAIRICDIAKVSGAQYDVGIMQINRYWIRKYAIPHKLLFSPSDNIYLGCFILAQEIKKGGLNWQSIGKYHSHTPWRRDAYATKIKRHLMDILVESRN